MLSSDTTGTPFGKRAACSFCFVPADTSVTVPRIVMTDPAVTPDIGASTVMELGPLPTV